MCSVKEQHGACCKHDTSERPSEALSSTSRAMMRCSQCDRNGHLDITWFANLLKTKKESRDGRIAKDRGKFSGFGNSGSNKQLMGCCHSCGKGGHKKADCRLRLSSAVLSCSSGDRVQHQAGVPRDEGDLNWRSQRVFTL